MAQEKDEREDKPTGEERPAEGGTTEGGDGGEVDDGCGK